jgi:catechol 2,3-dioxygenase-like lactoylglutathione lyase family enzyme
MGILEAAKPAVVICTRNRDRATAFYRDTLGLVMAYADRLAAVFNIGGITLRISTVADFSSHEHTILGFCLLSLWSRVASPPALAARIPGGAFAVGAGGSPTIHPHEEIQPDKQLRRFEPDVVVRPTVHEGAPHHRLHVQVARTFEPESPSARRDTFPPPLPA